MVMTTVFVVVAVSVVVMDVVVVAGMAMALSVAVGVSVGLHGGAVEAGLAVVPADITPAVGDVGGAPVVMVSIVEMVGSAELTVREVWEVAGRT